MGKIGEALFGVFIGLVIFSLLSTAVDTSAIKRDVAVMKELAIMSVDCETANKTLDPHAYYNYCIHKKEGKDG